MLPGARHRRRNRQLENLVAKDFLTRTNVARGSVVSDTVLNERVMEEEPLVHEGFSTGLGATIWNGLVAAKFRAVLL